MLYIVGNKKYISGEREPKQTSLTILRSQKLHLGNSFVYHTNLTENDALFLVSSGSIESENKIIESGNIIYVPKYSGFNFLATKPTELFEIVFNYSEKFILSSKKSYVIKAPLYTQEMFNQIYRNPSFCDNLPGVNEGLLLNILNTLNILCNSYSGELALYQKCHEWIEQHAFHPITAEYTAEAMGCTVAHLNRTVKKYSNKCLSVTIAEARISAIKQFVKFSNSSSQDIAQKLGFESAELLRKFFKYHTGVSLKEYKKQYFNT
jgi:AraC-like DNA-binding protein